MKRFFFLLLLLLPVCVSGQSETAKPQPVKKKPANKHIDKNALIYGFGLSWGYHSSSSLINLGGLYYRPRKNVELGVSTFLPIIGYGAGITTGAKMYFGQKQKVFPGLQLDCRLLMRRYLWWGSDSSKDVSDYYHVPATCFVYGGFSINFVHKKDELVQLTFQFGVPVKNYHFDQLQGPISPNNERVINGMIQPRFGVSLAWNYYAHTFRQLWKKQ